jgi:hypothetical protein
MGDFSTSALSQIRDSVTLALFDLIRIDDRPSGGYYAGRPNLASQADRPASTRSDRAYLMLGR